VKRSPIFIRRASPDPERRNTLKEV
jgi:hypothetical protein